MTHTDTSDVPQRLLALLDRLGEALARHDDAQALLGVGSVGVDLHRLDEHSDADFWVVVDDPEPWIADAGWLAEAGEVAWSFAHTHDGRKVLYADGLFAEYAVFSTDQLAAISRPETRVVWARDGFDHALTAPSLGNLDQDMVEHQAGEAITNLFVGLHRQLRGEVLAATRFVQSYAVDRAITILDLAGQAVAARQDPFALERSVEQRLPADRLPLAELVPGYGRNADAAEAVLRLLDAHADLHPAPRQAVVELIARVRAQEEGAQARSGA